MNVPAAKVLKEGHIAGSTRRALVAESAVRLRSNTAEAVARLSGPLMAQMHEIHGVAATAQGQLAALNTLVAESAAARRSASAALASFDDAAVAEIQSVAEQLNRDIRILEDLARTAH